MSFEERSTGAPFVVMDLSFPCVGNLDDGIFHDLGLEDELQRDADPADSSAADPLQSMVLSPDALDLALMAFDAGEEDSAGAETNDEGHGKSSSQSPFCDATISQKKCPCASPAVSPTKARCTARHSGINGANASTSFQKVDAIASAKFDQDLQKNQTRPSGSRDHKSSPRRNPQRWPPANEKREGMGTEGTGGISNAFPPRLPHNDPDVGPEVTSTTSTQKIGATTHRSTDSHPLSRRLPARAPNRPSLVVSASNAQSRWARQRAATRDAAVVASSVRREEEALAEADRTATTASTAASSDTTTCGKATAKRVAAASGVTHDGEKRKVVFADELAGSLAVEIAAASDDDGERQSRTDTPKRRLGGAGERQGEGGKGGGGEDGAQQDDDDLLARASELHSSVAGQLRSVNELLKRKSYFYIDTSWSAKQLPCPPTAWKGKSVRSDKGGGGGTVAAVGAGGGGPGVGTDSNSTVAPRHRPAASSSRNVAVRLEGRQWVSAGSKKAVGVHSIPGEKVHDPSWKNQDAGLAIAPVGRGEGQALFAIFDGHGLNGRQASTECMERLPKYLVSASRSGNPASALRRSSQRLHRDLASGVAGDCTRSGTTLCAAVLNGRRLTVANVGDSGCLRLSRRTPSPDVAPAGAAGKTSAGSSDATAAVAGGTSRRRGAGAVETVLPGAGSRAGGSRARLVAERLSRDHKPESAGELERIQAAGGVVFPLPSRRDTAAGGSGSGVVQATFSPAAGGCRQATGVREQELTTARDFGAGVPRVWRAGGDGPGLAMSRSIGDKMAHSVGVTYEPEISEFDLDPRSDVMLVLASDGVWDVMSAEDIRKAAEAHVVHDDWCPQALSMDICRKSLSEWATVTSGGSDDITCLVVKTAGVIPPKLRRASPCLGATEAPRNGNE